MNLEKIKAESKYGTKNIVKTIFQYSNILALAGIAVAILLFLLADKKKELTLSIDSFISLVDKNNLNGSGIKVSFDSVNVDNLYKVNFSISNTGNTPITKNDLVENIKISFDSNAKLLKYMVSQNPSTIKTNDFIKDNSIHLVPDLLNPTEKISMTTYYTVNKTSSLPKTNSRIIGGKIVIVNKSDEINRKYKFVFPVSLTIEKILFWVTFIWNILMFGLIVWALFFQKNDNNSYAATLIGFIIVGGGCILTIFYLISNELL